MRRITPCVFILAFIVLTASAADLRGVWRANVEGERVHLNLMRDGNQNGHSFSRADLQGLTDAQINSTTEVPVSITLARDAGTIAMTGTFEAGEGVGRFKFAPNRSFGDTLRALAVPIDEELSDEHLFSLAMLDISSAFIREMKSLGYSESLGQYTAFRIHGVTPQFVRELNALGYSKLTAEQLVTFRIHGVTPEFIRGMKELGYSASANDLVTFRVHGVTPDFVRELRDLGYTAVPSEQLVAMRIHGVTPRFIRELKEAGYQNVPVEKLIEMRIHGIDVEFLRRAH